MERGGPLFRKCDPRRGVCPRSRRPQGRPPSAGGRGPTHPRFAPSLSQRSSDLLQKVRVHHAGRQVCQLAPSLRDTHASWTLGAEHNFPRSPRAPHGDDLGRRGPRPIPEVLAPCLDAPCMQNYVVCHAVLVCTLHL